VQPTPPEANPRATIMCGTATIKPESSLVQLNAAAQHERLR
jgi:hypothetical protein